MTTTENHTHLPVNEAFGPVVQGEGPYTGRLASFIRLGRCNLACPGCDTPRTWDTTRYDLAETCPPTPVRELAAEVLDHDTSLIVITGGEPLLWQETPAWKVLLRTLIEKAHRPIQIHVETNGTIAPSDTSIVNISHFSVSPKLTAMAADGDPAKKRIRPAALRQFAAFSRAGMACLKIVCAEAGHVAEAAAFADEHSFLRSDVWIMPEGESHEAVTASARRIAEAAVCHGFNITPRLHLQLGVR